MWINLQALDGLDNVCGIKIPNATKISTAYLRA